MRGPCRMQHEVPQCTRPCLARGISKHIVHAAQLGLFRPGVKLAEEPSDLRLLPDPAFDKFMQHAPQPCAAASGGAEDPDHVLRIYAPILLAPLKAVSQPGASESRSVVQARRPEIEVPNRWAALYRPSWQVGPEQLRGLLGHRQGKGVHYVSKSALPCGDTQERGSENSLQDRPLPSVRSFFSERRIASASRQAVNRRQTRSICCVSTGSLGLSIALRGRFARASPTFQRREPVRVDTLSSSVSIQRVSLATSCSACRSLAWVSRRLPATNPPKTFVSSGWSPPMYCVCSAEIRLNSSMASRLPALRGPPFAPESRT